MAERYEIRLSGFGGQGLIFAGIVLAEAIGIYEGKYVTQTQSYGPEARGGKSKAEIVVSDAPILYPKALGVDLLLAMSQNACDTYFSDLKPSGKLIVDSTFVKESPITDTIFIPFTHIARTQIGKTIVANIVALGSICRISNIVSRDSLQKALVGLAPKGTKEVNLKALNAGIKAAAKF
ncbi:MAG: 2-oxoacid:acceptor oxidoreductase family protein [Desulfobacterales bacterium]|nr:2-oxoacid:acceptor oxidoreductase family protein [Desulfobacterales bacterium]